MERQCPFCQIVTGKREASIIHRDDILVVFKDIHPHAPVHLLIVPNKHIPSINDLTEEDREIVATMIMRARDVARVVSVDNSGYKLVFNVGRGAGQVIFHLHLHLMGGWTHHQPY